jgi:hypothetical protein
MDFRCQFDEDFTPIDLERLCHPPRCDDLAPVYGIRPRLPETAEIDGYDTFG